MISEFIHYSIYISDVLFSGSKIFIPIVFAFNIFSLENTFQLKRAIFVTLNLLLLTGGMLFALSIFTDMYLSFHSEDKAGWNFIQDILSGPHWYQYVLPVINFAFLPQIMWFKCNRRSIFISAIIVFIWWITFLLTVYLAKAEHSGFKPMGSFIKNDLMEYLNVMLVYIPIAVVVFFLFGRKELK